MRRRRYLQFGLRTLLAVTLVCGTALGWVESRRKYYARQMEAAEACHAAQFKFEPVGPDWLRSMYGQAAFQRVIEVSFHGGDDEVLEDPEFAVVRELPDLRYVFAGPGPPVITTRAGPFESRLTDGALAALDRLDRLVLLDVSHSQIDGSGLRWVPRDAPLSTLRLNGNELSDEGLKQVASFADLEALELEGASLPTAEPLGKFANLRELHLDRAYVADHQWHAIGRLASLERLDLGTMHIESGHFGWLAGLTGLHELSLGATRIEDQDLACLTSLKQLRRLDLDQTHVTSACLVHVSSLQGLQHLNLWMTSVSDAELERLTRLTQLRTLNLKGTHVSGASVPTLAQLQSLTRLHVGGRRFTKDELAQLTAALPTCAIEPY
jgi:hypothetical protein